MKQDVYETVTNKVLEMMEAHGANWINPFARKGKALQPHNIISKKPYRGINHMMLMWSPYETSAWGTFKQWNEKGCSVHKGEKATPIVFWQFIEKEDDKGQKVTIPFLRQYYAFNVAQVEGDFAERLLTCTDNGTGAEDIAAAEDFFRQIPADVHHTSTGRAYYNPMNDFISMPSKDVFEDTPTSTATESYYSTLSHELTHWTGHTSRLDRLTKSRFGDESYAREELVAEIGAALLCAHLEISSSPRPDHAQYLNGWMKALSDHKKEFVSAAAAASKAVDFVIEAAGKEA
jgi:antirestriction protein ArdC